MKYFISLLVESFFLSIFTSIFFLLPDAAISADYSQMKQGFPRLLSMNIGAKNYDNPEYQKQLAKMDVVILGFYKGWNLNHQADPVGSVLRSIKKINHNILIGQYTVLNEMYNNNKNIATLDIQDKIHLQNWWLRNSKGQSVQWTSKYNTWEINFTRFAKPDAVGFRYPEWLAQRNYKIYFSKLPELDIWYVDNIMHKPRVKADWDGDGIDDDASQDGKYLTAWREGYRAHWAHIRSIAPNILIMGNSGGDLSPEPFQQQIGGAFLEALMGERWSLENREGWHKMMARYRGVMANTVPPHLVGFNITGKIDDYHLFRYGFTSCLMDNGYFSYTDIAKGYSSVPWFDEYNLDLGRAIDLPPTQPWQKGVYRRLFEKGMVLVNPTTATVAVMLEHGYRAINGKQDSLVNHGREISTVILDAKDGIVLEKILSTPRDLSIVPAK